MEMIKWWMLKCKIYNYIWLTQDRIKTRIKDIIKSFYI